MAKKQQLPPPQPPSVPPERGIELLRRQREKGEDLLAARPIDEHAGDPWYNTTIAFLVECFGSGSHNLRNFAYAGGAQVGIAGGSKEYYEERRAEILEARLKILDSCIEQLEAKVEPGGVQGPMPGTRLGFDSLHTMVVRRCKGPFEAGRYDDAIRNAFIAVEEEIRARISGDPTDLGVELVTKAMNPSSPRLVFSKVKPEQEAAHLLYRGAIGYIKNPLSHRFLDTTDPDRTFELLAFASLLLRMLDEAT
jgi:uncharacterized protein (TIGR02391 family)